MRLLPDMLIKPMEKLRRLFKKILPFEVRLRWPRRHSDNRYEYQKKLIDFDIKPGEKVLDVGSGNKPFPHATVLGDLYLEMTEHRRAEIVRDGRPLVVFDVQAIPFPDKSFDYVYCSHLLEHVDDPVVACAEIIRVGKRGYIETPTFAKDMLSGWTGEGHTWHIVGIGRELHFFEYTAKQREGVGDSYWRDAILGDDYHPLQATFYENQDLFNVMFSWRDDFKCIVHRLKDAGE